MRTVRKILLAVALIGLIAVIAVLVIGGSGKASIESVSISGNAEYYADEFDPSLLKIQLHYADGTVELLPLSEGSVKGDLSGSVGQHTFSITYEWYYSEEFTYTVVNRTFEGYDFDSENVVYDGNAQSILPTDLPEGTRVQYRVNGELQDNAPVFTDAGEYVVTALLTRQYYDDLEIEATLTISPLSIGVEAFAGIYDGDTLLSYIALAPGKTSLVRLLEDKAYIVKASAIGALEGDDLSVVVEGGSLSAIGPVSVRFKLAGEGASNYKIKSPYVNVKIVGEDHPMLTFTQPSAPSVMYVVEDGTLLNSVGYADPTPKEGYEVSWNWPDAFLDESGALNEAAVISGDHTIPVNMQATRFNLTYVGGEVSDTAPTYYTKDELTVFEKPLTTSLDELRFEGWYTTPEFLSGTKVTDTSTLSGDVTLYAKWVERKISNAPGFTSYIDEEENIRVLSINKAYGSTHINLEYIFSVSEGCTWALGEMVGGLFVVGFKEMDLQPGDNFKYVRVIDENGEYTEYKINVKVLSATDTAEITYTFLDAAGNKHQDVSVPGNEAVSSDVLKLYDSEPVRVGYKLIGWQVWNYNTRTWEDVTYDEVNGVYRYKVTGGETFRPVYETIKYQYELNANKPERAPEDVSPTIPATNEFTLFDKVVLPTVSEVSMKGYEFLGWFTTPDPAEGDEPVTFIPVGTVENKTFYAVWAPITYTVTFDATEGAFVGETLKYEYTIESDTFEFATEDIVSRLGYTFTGWYTEDGAMSKVERGSIGDLALSARWQKNKYTVYFNAGYTSTQVSTEVYTDTPFALTVAEPFVRDGYKFIGWSDVKNSDTAKYQNGESFTFTPDYVGKDVIFYAVWEANKFSVSFDLNGGAGSFADISAETGESVKLHSGAPTREHYDFAGWADENGRIYYQNASYTMPANGGKLTATWKLHTYKIVYMLEGVNKTGFSFNNADKSINMTIESDTVSLEGCLPQIAGGHTFYGWYSDAELTAKKTSVTVADLKDNKDVVIYPSFVKGTEGLRYSLVNAAYSYYEVTGFSSTSVTDIVIPESYGSGAKIYPVKSIKASAFANNTTIKSVTVASNVTNIGARAFSGCSALETVTVLGGDQILAIANHVFEACASLKTVKLPARVESIGEFAFYNAAAAEVLCEAAEKPADWETTWCVIGIVAENGELVVKTCDVKWGQTL
ncbi:MAG: hypothetical protein E7617_06440 [Ruminococcaceae bacterium]|nr:hypothetical protein [Oscillospiraceae bacterium]